MLLIRHLLAFIVLRNSLLGVVDEDAHCALHDYVKFVAQGSDLYYSLRAAESFDSEGSYEIRHIIGVEVPILEEAHVFEEICNFDDLVTLPKVRLGLEDVNAFVNLELPFDLEFFFRRLVKRFEITIL